MHRLAWIAITLAAFAIGSSTATAAAALKIEQRKLTDHGAALEITAMYPHTGVASIDDEIETWVRKEVADFRKQAARDADDHSAYTLHLAYEVARNDARLLAFEFTESTYTGGAHGGVAMRSCNYLMPDGHRVDLPELLDGGKALARLSALAIADLQRQSSAQDDLLDDETIKLGAGPDWDNFAVFVLLKDALRIVFPPYQVGSWAAGPQEVDIPLAQLRTSMRADWRAPAASFACAKAASVIEHAICADVALARLDREVAQAYARQTATPGPRAAMQARQRAWLGERDAACKDKPAAALGACLTGLYRTRLAELAPTP
ncbi:DUF3298 domain-containing protein [Dokdonella soli]|uniref:DUF3298 domain-containing protein n=1 Tax=Dokdonella soli TaxID=529810 RepID=A0ABN1IH07_9GAMM